MANEICFLYPLSPEVHRTRVWATKEYGSISSFVVQYEGFLRISGTRSCGMIQAMTFLIKILYIPTREDKQPLAFPSYNIAFTSAIQDLKASWRWYRTGYEREIVDDSG